MVSLYSSCPISSFAYRNLMIDSDTLLSLYSFASTFNPNYNNPKTCIRFAVIGCGFTVLGFLEVKPRRKKSCCSRVLRMCNKRDLGWESDGSKDLESEVLEFMKNSERPGMFPSKKDFIRSRRFDLDERVVNQGGWLSMGWDSDSDDEEVKENAKPWDLHIEKHKHEPSLDPNF